jgi:hypothetical protein
MHRIAASLLVIAASCAAEAVPVAVGAGSYASEPPAADAKLRAFLAEGGRFDPSVPVGTPMPSNDWCSYPFFHADLGHLWAYPLVVSADRMGALIALPMVDSDGKLERGTELAVVATAGGGTATTTDLVRWKPGTWPKGWTTEGSAWGDGPVAGVIDGQSQVAGQHAGLANSYHGGDRPTGNLTSPVFTISRPHLHAQLGGGRNAQLRLELVVDGKAVQSATGENSGRLRWVSWDITAWKGKQARLRAVDAATGGWSHLMLGDVVLSDDARDPDESAAIFPADAQRPLRWGDWTATFRIRAESERWLDLTCGRGLPFAWVEAKGLGLTVPIGTGTLSGLDGKALPKTGAPGALIVRDGRRFAVYAATGTLRLDGEVLHLEGGSALAVGAILPEADPMAWRAHALAIPRDSRMEWTYDRAKGRVETTWTLTTEGLGSGAGEPLTGWLPHHWRSAMGTTTLLPGSFTTPRGKLRLAVGGIQRIGWRFNGVVPGMPAPEAGGEPAFDAKREEGYLTAYVGERAGDKPKYGGDTYWGGKDLLMHAQTALVATLAGSSQATAIVKASRTALTDWLTWTPGEKEHYFARYERLGALVGFKGSYGSEQFTDNHFHLGYLTQAAALHAIVDPGFARDYGGMLTLVAKQYANWDRADRRFPLLRTFDPWAGHSHAGGSSSDNGNNQESSSESMQSWTGLTLLGAALGDRAMTDCGAMGYAIEGEATREYWNDYYGWKDPAAANLPASYGHSIVGIVGDSGNAFGTFFDGRPRFIYGIQWLPLSPGLQYVGADPAFGLRQWNEMVREQRVKDPGFDLEKLDGGWDHVALGYLLLNDPVATTQRFEALYKAGHAMATKGPYNPVTYWLMHGYRSAGTIDQTCWTDQPTACVYRKADGSRSVVAWNPGTAPLPVTAYAPAGVLCRTEVKAGGLVRFTVKP